MDYFTQETEQVKKLFNLDEISSFQLKHKVEIVRGEDCQYLCYIDNEGYGTSLTPLMALTKGIKQFKSYGKKKTNTMGFINKDKP
jgi:hypothetical protein